MQAPGLKVSYQPDLNQDQLPDEVQEDCCGRADVPVGHDGGRV